MMVSLFVNFCKINYLMTGYEMFYTQERGFFEETREWFQDRKDKSLPEVFFEYFIEARRGDFRYYFYSQLQESVDSLNKGLYLSNNLSLAIHNIINVPLIKLRRIFGLIVYWLSAATDINTPSKSDFFDIVNGILGDEFLFMG